MPANPVAELRLVCADDGGPPSDGTTAVPLFLHAALTDAGMALPLRRPLRWVWHPRAAGLSALKMNGERGAKRVGASRFGLRVSATLLTVPIEARAEAVCPVILRSCSPGTVVAVDRVAAPPVGEGIVAIIAGAVLVLAIIAGMSVYNVRARALDTELEKLALRDRRCSPAEGT